MQTIYIKNYWNKDPIAVSSMTMSAHNPVVIVSQVSGSMAFNHAMTCDQAREMAAALLVAISEAEEQAAKEAATA